MANTLSRIDAVSTDITSIGLELRMMLADGKIDAEELRRLHRRADDIMECGLIVEDIALDVAEAAQCLHIGRNKTPNKHLRQREIWLTEVMEQREASADMRHQAEAQPVRARV